MVAQFCKYTKIHWIVDYKNGDWHSMLILNEVTVKNIRIELALSGQLAQVPAAKPGDQSLVPGTHIVEGENGPPKVWPPPHRE